MEATLQNIFRQHYEPYRQRHRVSMEQHRAGHAIMDCRSESLGYEEWACPTGEHTERHYHSCRNRSCPRCYGGASHDWLEKVKVRLLPCAHYHTVFTLPHELIPLWQYNRAWCADRLFKATSETVKELLADERYLGAEAGMLAALHTWGRTLNFHPHVHLLVSGGGLRGAEWHAARNDYLLPVGVLKAKFRGKWLSWLNAAFARGELVLPPEWSLGEWRKVLRTIARKSWNVRIQGAYDHAKGVAIYLSRYVRGGPIKDRRIDAADRERVRFHYRDSHDGSERHMDLPAEQFMRRILWHVPVKGQHMVRYYGLYTPQAAEKRAAARDSHGVPAEDAATETRPVERICPACGCALIHRLSTRRRISYIRKADVQQPDRTDRGHAWCEIPQDRHVFFWPEKRPFI